MTIEKLNHYKCIRCDTTEIGLFMTQVKWPMQPPALPKAVLGQAVLTLCDDCKKQNKKNRISWYRV